MHRTRGERAHAQAVEELQQIRISPDLSNEHSCLKSRIREHGRAAASMKEAHARIEKHRATNAQKED